MVAELKHHLSDALLLPRQPAYNPQNEARDLGCEDSAVGVAAVLSDSRRLDRVLDSFAARESTILRPEKVRSIPGMGTIWDYTGFTTANGGRIDPLVFVQHIPVIQQMDGRADLDVLWKVLVNQGLMVHNGTDGEGNVALYVTMGWLCFHARGANSFSVGTEHMHLTTAEGWSMKQLNAAAWLSYRAHKHQGIPFRRGRLGDGNGIVTVRRRGHTTHEAVSNHAGFRDRSDPGDRYEALMDEIRDRAVHFDRHHKF